MITAETTASLQMQDQARQRIPGMTQLLSKRPELFAPGVWPGYFSRAKGAEVWDLDNRRYTDMSISGIGANILGYADDDVDAAVHKAIDSGTSCSLNCAEEVELAELLCNIHPWAESVRYARTGGEAMAVAVRIVRALTGRDKIAFCGYHGWHDWYLAANVGTENALGEHLLSGLNPRGVPRSLAGTALPFRYEHLEELEEIVNREGDQLAAIVMEPLRDHHPAEGFLEGIRRLADKCGAVLVFDEITAAFRLNTGGAHLELGLDPDMAVYSKALGNGYPIAAIIGRSEIMEAAQTTFISSTNWTERIGPTAALATIRKHQRFDVAEHLKAIGEAVQNGWRDRAAAHDLPIEIGGIYPLSHFAFLTDEPMVDRALFVQMMLEKNFLASTDFYAMYAQKEEHVRAYLKVCDQVFAEIATLNRSGQSRSALRGEPAQCGFKRLT